MKTQTKLRSISIAFVFIVISQFNTKAQHIVSESLANRQASPTGQISNQFASECNGLVQPNLNTTPWLTHIKNLEKKHPQDSLLEKLIKEKTKQKLGYLITEENSHSALKKSGLGVNFKGNTFNGGAPPDNSLAISTSGYIVSMVNCNIAYYTQTGQLLWTGSFWELFNDPSLNQLIYDPIVVFDAQANRFVLIALHGFTSATSKLLLGFSKTDNPTDGWYFYQLSGNPKSNGCWLDYPKLGVSNDEVFVTGNLFSDQTGFSEAVIYQINKSKGYNGESLVWRLWSNISGNPITLIPAPYGQDGTYGPGMYFVCQSPASGNAINIYEVSNTQNNNPQLLRQTIFKQEYGPSGYASQLGTTVQLITGDCRILNAFYLNNKIHYVFQEEFGNTGFTCINYNEVNLTTLTNKSVIYGKSGTDYAFPALASFGKTTTDPSVAVCFLKSNASMYPAAGAIVLDSNGQWQPEIQLKAGTTYVDAFAQDDVVRWGDYAGVAFRKNQNKPEVWMSGCYGATQALFGTNYNCFLTWIGQISTDATNGISAEKVALTQESKVYPNPAIDLFAVEFEVPEAGNVEIVILKTDGSLVNTLFNATLKKGKNLLTLNRAALSSGVYFLKALTPTEELLTKKLVIE